MSYHFGLGERAKERVDTHGHVMLTDEETRKLWHTKALCTVTSVVGTLWLVSNGAVVASIMSYAFHSHKLVRLSAVANTKGSFLMAAGAFLRC